MAIARDLEIAAGGPGIAYFTWRGESGRSHRLVWQDDGRWLFGVQDAAGEWVYHGASLPAARTAGIALRIARRFQEEGESDGPAD